MQIISNESEKTRFRICPCVLRAFFLEEGVDAIWSLILI